MKALHHTLALAACIAACMACTAAWADHPLVSETADALPRGTCQVEFTRANQESATLPKEGRSDMQFSCGAGARSQLAIGINSSRAQGLRAEHYRLVGMTTFIAPIEGQTGFGVRYGLGWTTGQGQQTELDARSILAVASREVRNGVLVHANLGFKRNRLLATTTGVWSLGVETTDAFSLAADFHGEERSKPSVSAGAGWRASKDVLVSLAYAVQTGDEKTRSLSLGLKLVF